MATHSSVLAWRIPGTGEPGGLLSMGSHRVGHNWSDLAVAAATPWIQVLYIQVLGLCTLHSSSGTACCKGGMCLCVYVCVCVCVCVCICVLLTQSGLILCNPMDRSLPVSSVHGILPSKNTGVGSYSLLQEIFTTQGFNACLLHCKQILYHLSLQVSPKEAYCRGEGIILEKCGRKKMGRILLYGLLYFLTALMILVTYHNTPLLNFTHYLFTVLSCANITTV